MRRRKVQGKKRSSTTIWAVAATAVGWLLLASASSSGAVPPTVGIGRDASLADLYEYLQVPPPRAVNWAPTPMSVECSKDWVVWSDGPNDPLPPTNQQICRGRWRGSNHDYCRSAACGCEMYRQCSVRWAMDVCERSGQGSTCAEVLYQRNVSEAQRPAERTNCRQQVLSRVRERAGGGPYRYWSQVSANSNFNFVCAAQYAVTPVRTARVPDCGCQTVAMCENPCRTEAVASSVALTRDEAVIALEDQNDPEDEIVESSLDCETHQDDGSLSASSRYDGLTVGSGASDPASRIAFQSTKRLMHELDMMRPTAEDFVRSALAIPGCGVSTWLTTSAACEDQVPVEPFAASINCARLLSSHVGAPTITEDVYRLCTDTLRTIAQAPYSDDTCRSEVQEDVAQLARALRDKANTTMPTAASSTETREIRTREIGQ